MRRVGWGVPNFSDQIVNCVPGNGTVSDGTPPAHQICRFHICMGVKVVGNGNFVIPEGGSDETNAELGRVRRGRGLCLNIDG